MSNAYESLGAMVSHQRLLEQENVTLRRELAAARALMGTVQQQQCRCQNAECGTAAERFGRLQGKMLAKHDT